MPRPAVLAACLTIACTTGDPSAPSPAPPTNLPVETEPTPVSSTDGPEYFFAVASQTGVEHCPDGSSVEWLDVQPTLGWATASGPAAAQLDALVGAPVLARGSVGPRPPRPPLPVEPRPCPVMQMRSDWVSTPVGIRARRTQSAADHFVLSSVRRLDELRVELVGDQLVASFRNPLEFALTGVALRIHYEGCYGKPGARVLASEPVTLGPGELLRHEFPRIAEQAELGADVVIKRGGPRVHLAAALVLEIGGSEGPREAAVWSDLDVSLRALGLEFGCR